MGQQILEVEFVIIGTDLYLRGPTGNFRKLSTSSVFSSYDPTVILDPNRGIAAVLANSTEATTEAREQVDGVDSYRLEATFPGNILATFMPGANQETTGQVWLATEGSRLVQARFPTSDGTTVTLRLSDYNAPADITAPS
ncbi:MAG: LppX_LprAFG lipoprotein, partial [Actinomycetes bacterium]